MSLSKLIATKLSREQQQHLIKRLKDEVLSCIKPKSLILFGSASRYEMTEASDLDLVVIVASAEEIKPAFKALRLTSMKIDWPLDLLITDEKTFQARASLGGVYYIAQTEGTILFTV